MSSLFFLNAENAKTVKGESKGYQTFVLYLAPAELAGVGNMCPKSTPGCRAGCLNLSGHGGMIRRDTGTNPIQEARKRKTRWLAQDREGFMAALKFDIQHAIDIASGKGLTPVVRLNGTSDLSWERYPVGGKKNIFEVFPDVNFYDYTKVLGRRIADIPNYHLTFSASDGNDDDVARAIDRNMNVAVVFRKTLPETYMDRTVIDGDENDLRFLDPKGVIVGLKAKGVARKDTSGFVVDI